MVEAVESPRVFERFFFSVLEVPGCCSFESLERFERFCVLFSKIVVMVECFQSLKNK